MRYLINANFASHFAGTFFKQLLIFLDHAMSAGVGLRSRSSSEATSFSSRPLPVSPSDSES